MQGGERHEAFDYPDEQWVYYLMAEKFGWTPDQVDNVPAATVDWLMAIAGVAEQVRAERFEEL
jgi:hypothetical protein